jgi:glutathione reductase (NADPH)
MEFAHISKRAGASEVTVLEMVERPLGNFDPDLVDILAKATIEMGIDLQIKAKHSRLRADPALLTSAG